jgi:hypothetical protein
VKNVLPVAVGADLAVNSVVVAAAAAADVATVTNHLTD